MNDKIKIRRATTLAMEKKKRTTKQKVVLDILVGKCDHKQLQQMQLNYNKGLNKDKR